MRKQRYRSVRQEEVVTERHVQAIWYDGALRPTSLHTTQGAPVEVLDPGEWNLEAGPDFRHASLKVAGRLTNGDVEVHLRPADWRVHGHAHDSAYAGVVAHVTWFGDTSAGMARAKLPPGCVSICLGDAVRARLGFSPLEIDLAAYPYARPPTTLRPCTARFADNWNAAEALLRAAGRRRLAFKARQMAERFRETGRVQALYEALFAALGYKHNTFPFREVAQVLPWCEVPDNPAAAQVCYETVAGLKVTAETPWRLANVRPANAPVRRLAAAARLFSQGPALCDRLMACALATRKGQLGAIGILCEGGRIGAGRAGAMLANAIVPYALATGALAEVPEWLSPEDVSAPVRQTAFRLLGRDHNPTLYARNGLLIQGLLHIHHVFCRTPQPACGTCPLGAAKKFVGRITA